MSTLEAKVDRLTQLVESLVDRAGVAERLLTVNDVATQLRRSRKYVERLMKEGKLKKVPDLGARTTRFRPADVARLLGADVRPGRRQL